jgi:hypothetical protein
MRRLLPPCLALAAFLSAPAAHAGPGFDVDLSMGPHLGGGAYIGSATIAYAVAGRAGWRFALGPVWIQPDAGGEYTAIHDGGYTGYAGTGVAPAAGSFQIARVLVGARIGALVGRVVEPALYAHGAVAWLLGQHGVGPAVDAGVAIDLKLVPRLRFGIHSAYNHASFSVPCPAGISCEGLQVIGPSVDWLTYGVHAGMGF